jgi:hypothetical protein
MQKKYHLLGTPGSNINYIGLVLTDCVRLPVLTYHYHLLGSHTKDFEQANFRYSLTYDYSCRNALENPSTITIQILCKDKFQYILLNWFHKWNNKQDSDFPYLQKWMEQQDAAWAEVHDDKDTRLSRAVLHWFYKFNDREFIDIKDINEIKNKFLFESFYTGYHLDLQKEFDKYKKNYTKYMYDQWAQSQNIVFRSADKIEKNIEHPERLDTFFEKGIAMGLYGQKSGLSETDTWRHFYKNKNN